MRNVHGLVHDRSRPLRSGHRQKRDFLRDRRASQRWRPARAEAAAASNALKTVETGINYYAARKEYMKLKDIAEASDVAGKVCAHCRLPGPFLRRTRLHSSALPACGCRAPRGWCMKCKIWSSIHQRRPVLLYIGRRCLGRG